MDIAPNVITISYGRQLFNVKNPEHQRHITIARSLGQLHMVVFTRRSEGFHTIESDAGLTIYPTNSRHRLLMPFDAFTIAARIIKDSTPKPVVTTQDPATAGLVGVLLRWWYGVHLVVQEHCDIFSTPYWRTENVKNRIEYQIAKFVIKRADVIRLVAKRIEPAIRALGALAPVTQLPVAIDPQPFLAAQSNRPHHRDIFEYLTVARLVKQKNLPLLISAFKKAFDTDSRLRLRVVGSGPEEATIKKEIENAFPVSHYPSCPITMLSWTDDVPALMRQADAYVLSSNYEGWGRVLIEAVLAELPIVTTDVGCVGEVIHDKDTALVVPLNDVDALATAMNALASDEGLYTRLVAAARELKRTGVPGTNIVDYGAAWRDTLTASK